MADAPLAKDDLTTDAAAPARISPSAWYALSVLTAISLFAHMDRMALALLLEPIKADLHLKDWQLGLLSGFAFAAVYALMGIPLARMADRSSRVRLLAGCMVFWSAMTALSGFARSFPQLFLARMGVGVGEAGYMPSAHSMIGDLFSRARRPLAVAIFQSGGSMGTSVGLFVIGLLGHHLGWRASLQIAGLAGLPLALLALLTIREPARPPKTSTGQEPALHALRALLRRPAYVNLVVAYALGSVCMTGISTWVPTFLIRSFGMNLAEVGAWSGLSSVIGGVLGLMTGGVTASWLAARDPRWELWIPTLAFVLCAPMFVGMCLSQSAWLALVFKTGAIYLAALGSGVTLSTVHSFAEPHRRGTAIAMMLFLTSFLGQGLGAYLIGLFSDLLEPIAGRESLRYALLISCVILAWSIAHYLLAVRTSARDRVN
jgi:predicted MFS family arabinose efflux permease